MVSPPSNVNDEISDLTPDVVARVLRALFHVSPVDHPHQCQADRRVLQALLDPTPPPSVTSSLIHYDAPAQQLTLPGVDLPWTIRGTRQSAAVQYVVDQYHRGRRWVSAAEILAAAYPNKPYGKSRRLSSLFHGNAQWRDYLANPSKGIYGLRGVESHAFTAPIP